MPESQHEKKILTLPPARVSETTKRAIEEYALVHDRSVSWVLVKAAEEFLDREQDKHERMSSIFAGRERFRNLPHVEHCDNDE